MFIQTLSTTFYNISYSVKQTVFQKKELFFEKLQFFTKS
jgi:hypothetical protein